MDIVGTPGSGRVREIRGNVPIQVVLWLEQHPTAALACVLAVSAPSVRWIYRVGPTTHIVLRNDRVDVVDSGSNAAVGAARIHGVRSAADFDAFPRTAEPSPFVPPEPRYPATCGFASDLDGRVARFQPVGGQGTVGPGLVAKLDRYDSGPPRIDELVDSMAPAHAGPAAPAAAFVTRVRDLVSALALPTVTGQARMFAWFEDERVFVLPQGQPGGDFVSSVLSALHSRRHCLGCARHDPRDRLRHGTYAYGRPPGGVHDAFVRNESPALPLDVPSAARLLGRSPAELAATRLELRFAEAARVDPGNLRRAT